MERAAQEKARAQAAAYAAMQESAQTASSSDTQDSYVQESNTADTYEEISYEDTSYEDTYDTSWEDTYEDTSYEETASSSSGSGVYLGNFKLTAYCNCASCCGTAGNPTASGTMPSAGRTVAMGGIDFGTQLMINGSVYTVEDRGTPYGHVDIFFNSHSEALSFGLQYADVYQMN
jgi:3D (Asp-Asp-Asp) domain-containing protein